MSRVWQDPFGQATIYVSSTFDLPSSENVADVSLQGFSGRLSPQTQRTEADSNREQVKLTGGFESTTSLDPYAAPHTAALRPASARPTTR